MKFYFRAKSVLNKMFNKHLFITNTAIGIGFMGAGDVIQQNLERKILGVSSYEPKRTGNMMTVGCGFGILGHVWYRMLDSKFPGNKGPIIAKKLLAEMIVGPPLVLSFFIAIGLLEKKPVEQSFKEFKQNFFLICMADWVVYAPLQAINFYFLPPNYRFLYVGVLTLVYDVFLSYIIHKDDKRKSKLQAQGS